MCGENTSNIVKILQDRECKGDTITKENVTEETACHNNILII